MKSGLFIAMFGLFAVFALLFSAPPAIAQLGAAPSNAQAAYRRALALERRGDMLQANTQFQQACKGGDARGCLALGHNLRTGNTVPQDLDAAKRWYGEACEGDIGAGCSALGYMAMTGLGAATDHDLALSYYQRGCELGDQSGCAGAGNLLLTGIGGMRDRTEGGRLLRESCKAGYEWSCVRLRDLGQPLNLGQ